MVAVTLPRLLHSLQGDIAHQLQIARQSFDHSTIKGDASETVWLTLLQTYLPFRYQAARAQVVDSRGGFSDQLDIVIFDRQYTPLIFRYGGQSFIPAESVYAVFEVKQTINRANLADARKKLASVRRLFRTNMPIVHAGGKIQEPKKPFDILGGVVSLTSEWSSPLGDTFQAAMADRDIEAGGWIDLGCIADHGAFALTDRQYTITKTQPATAFLFTLIARLQALGTVPAIDMGAYAEWLNHGLPSDAG